MSGDFGLGDFGDVTSVVETVADAVVDTALITNRGYGYGYGGFGYGYGGWGYGGTRSTGFLAAFLGLCLLVGTILLIHWNETQGASRDRLIDKRLKTVVELDAGSITSQPPDTIVHATGLAQAGTPVDALLNISIPHAIALERKVEMYQWTENVTHKKVQIGTFDTGDTTAAYDKAWSETPVDSSHFQYEDGHRNPDGFPMLTSPVKGQAPATEPLRSQHFAGEAPHLGAYAVAPELAAQMTSWTPLTISTVTAPAGFSIADGTAFYKGGDSTNPQIGDVRVTFRAVLPQPYSVIGTVQDGTLAGYHNGFNLALAKPGYAAVSDMLKTHSYRPQTQIWLIRFLAFGMVFIALLMMASPIEALVGWIPILGGLVEMGLMFAALTLAVPVTATAIALAWLGQRPIAAIAIFVAGGTLGGIMWWHHLRIARHNAEVKAYMARHDAQQSAPMPAHHSEFSQF